jgi:hypothetical protein
LLFGSTLRMKAIYFMVVVTEDNEVLAEYGKGSKFVE